MLDDRSDDVPPIGERFRHAADREVVRFGPARREHHLVGVALEQGRDPSARLLDRVTRRAAERVSARGIAEVIA